MDVRWNATYLMLKHLVPYKEVFYVFINSNYGSAMLTPNHWYCAEKILEFLELFYDYTVVVSSVYYSTSPLVLHHVLEIASHLHACERDQNLLLVVYPIVDVFGPPTSKFVFARLIRMVCSEDTRVYTSSGGMSLRPVRCCSCYRHLVCNVGYKHAREGKDPKSLVEGVNRVLRLRAHLPLRRVFVLCSCVVLIPHRGAPCFSFYRRRESVGYRGGK